MISFTEMWEWIQLNWKVAIEVSIFWYAYYILLRFLSRSGALQILRGVFVLFIFFLSIKFLGLNTIAALIAEIIPISVIAFLILFQNELRRGLLRIGQSPLFKLFLKEEKLVDEIIKTATGLSKKRIGALMALEREIGLKQYQETGIQIDGILSFELLSTIFMHNTPLHDGGVIIQGSRVASAGCVFPLSQNQRISKSMGTRHRAALGLTEESDAVAIVISEETGAISIAEGGEFVRDIEVNQLRKKLMTLYTQANKNHSRSWMNWFLEKKKSSVAG